MLNEKMIRALQAGEKITDDTGRRGRGRLIIQCSTSGKKTWIFRDRSNGHDRSRVIGEWPAMSLLDARIAADDLGNQLAAGQSPTVKLGTVNDLITAYIASLGNRPSARQAKGALMMAIPLDSPLRKMPANEITPDHLSALCRRLHQSGATTAVNRLRAWLSAAWNYGGKSDHDPKRTADAVFRINSNPAAMLPLLAEWEVPRDRVLSDKELVDFLKKARARNDAIGDFAELLLLTGARLIQLQTAELRDGLLIITDTKGRSARAKICVLPITETMQPLLDRGRLAAAMHPDTVAKGIRKMLPVDATPRDIRRTVETRLQELGISREIRGALLSHGNTGVQAKHYERAELLQAKREALDSWHHSIKNI